jgi:hypothetical protein
MKPEQSSDSEDASDLTNHDCNEKVKSTNGCVVLVGR